MQQQMQQRQQQAQQGQQQWGGQQQKGQQQKGGPQQGWGAAQKGGPKGDPKGGAKGGYGKGGKDQQSQQAEMARKRQEQASTLTIRRVITKLRSATPESIDEVKAELQTTLAKELGNCGAQTVKMQEEAEKGVQMATQRIEQLLVQKRELEAKKAAMELQRKEARETAEKLLKELEALGAQSETMIQEMKEKSEPLKEAAETSTALVEKTAKAVEEMGNNAKEKVKSVADFLRENSQKMKVPPKEGSVDIAAGITKAFSKNSEHTREAEIAITFAKATLAKMAKKARATKMMEAMSATFAKFNKAKDGFMSKGEVKSYARTTFKFTLSDAALKQMFALLGAEKGVKKDDFQRLKVMIGCAREKEKDEERRKERLEKEAVLEGMKKEAREQIAKALEAILASEELVKKADSAAAAAFGKASKTEASGMAGEADDLDKLVAEAKEDVEKTRGAMKSLAEGIEDDIKAWATGELRVLEAKMKTWDARVSKVTATAAKMRDIAKRKELAELAVVEGRALAIMRFHQREEKLSKEQLFELFDADKDGKVCEAEFVKFFENCKRPPKANAEKKEGEAEAGGGGEDELEPAPAAESLSKVFKGLDEDEEGFLSKGRFGMIMISVMKVVTETKLSKEAAADSDAVRQLDKGEVVEVIEAPVEEGKTKRAKVVAIKDGAAGYVTVTDDAGAVFLREGGKMFKVVKETIMTECFDLEEDASENKVAARKLKVGELVEVREYPKKEEKSGLTRMRCKAKTDGRLGWATTLGNVGAVFLEVA